jgi:nucleoside-diphosphate-sugar epimerase
MDQRSPVTVPLSEPRNSPTGRKALVAGGAGYVGLGIVRRLLAAGWKVTVLDSLRHGCPPPDDLTANPDLRFVHGDLRDLSLVDEITRGQDAALLLAALVGEPACDREPDAALQTNVLASLNLLETVRRRGVKRFIFTSTDSSSGARGGEKLDENSPLDPLSLYARQKTEMEREILSRPPIEGFSPTILRLATVYGLAPRMRFDLAVNLLVRESTLKGSAKIFSGEQWRPLVHVADVASAFLKALDAPTALVDRQIFNVGANSQNVQFKELGKLLERLNPDSRIEYVPVAPDLRDYYVKFDKIAKILNFKPQISLLDGMTEIRDALKAGVFSDPYEICWRNS